MTAALDQALAYAARGWRVIPVPPGGKFPHGFEKWQILATTDEATIRQWWTTHPTYGIGIATGPGSGIWVLDIDVADGKTGDETLADLEAGYGELPGTYEVITGSGGRHLYFAWPADMEVRNRQSGLLGAGIDVRGEGGFVVAPPSLHANGSTYEVEASSAPLPAPAPAWLLALLREPERQPRVAQSPSPDAGTRPGDIWAASVTWDEILSADGWTHHHTAHNGEDYWTRPGKQRREGASATVGYEGNDMLWVGTTSMAHAGLQSFTSYDKLGYLAATRHGGHIAEAARWCRAQGHHSHGAEKAAPEPEPEPEPEPAPHQPITLSWVEAEASEPPEETAPEPATTAAAVVEHLPEAPADPWPTPPPLDEPEGFPELPIDAFPNWMAAQIRNVADQLLCDPMLPAVFGLGALSVASLGHIQINVRAGHVMRTTGLYLVAAGPPASGKSPALDFMMGPVREYEQGAIAAAASTVAEAAAAKQIATKSAKTAIDMAALGETPDPEKKATALRLAREAEAIEIPPSGELITGDITPERLASVLAENGERFAVVSDEAGVLNVDRYGDKTGATKMELYLQGFTGQPAQVHRQNAPTIRLNHPLLAIVIGVQPAPLAAAFASREMRQRGFVQRFLVARTAQEAANTDYDRDVWDHQVGQEYHDRLLALAKQWGSWGTNPGVMTLSPPARTLLSTWAADLRTRGTVGEELEGESEWVSKMRDSTIRIAALLHLGDGNPYDAEVQEATARRATTIAEWFIAHFVRETEDTAEDARRLLAALTKITTKREQELADLRGTAPKKVLTAKQALAKGGPVGLRTIKHYAPALEQLVTHGWARLAGVTGPAGQAFEQAIRSCADIEVNPLAKATRDDAVARGSAVPAEPHAMPHTKPETGSAREDLNVENDRAPAPNSITRSETPSPSVINGSGHFDPGMGRGNAVDSASQPLSATEPTALPDPLAGTPWAVQP